MDHGCDETEVDDVEKIARFLQIVEPFHLKQLTDDLVGALVPPRVDVRQVDIVDEDCQLLASRRTVRVAHSFVHAAFDIALLKIH